MIIHTLPVGYLQTNCYIIEGEDDRCLIIDPGAEAERIGAFLDAKGLTAEAILLTHGHFDHVGAVKPLARRYGCRVFLNERDLALPAAITGGTLYATDRYGEGDNLTLAGLDFTVLEAPGHTPGSVCLLFDKDMFCGDVLFAGSCGRTDLPGGDPSRMTDSLRRLAGLEKNYTVWPGHGEPTELDREKRYNMYLR